MKKKIYLAMTTVALSCAPLAISPVNAFSKHNESMGSCPFGPPTSIWCTFWTYV